MEKRICTNCKNAKPFSEFSRDKKRLDGMASWCRECVREAGRRWAAKNKESIKQRKIRTNDRIVQKGKERWIAKKEHISKINRTWAALHPDKMREYNRLWRARNYEHAKEIGRKSAAKRISSVPGKLNNRISTDIRSSIVRGSKACRPWELLVGYTVGRLKKHLEKQFTPEMSWENYGNYWELDHKIPKVAFNFETPDDIDFKRCWALDNLRPLEKQANRIKGKKLNKPFQPSLIIAA